MQKTLEALKIAIKKYSLKGYGVGVLPSGKEVEVAHSVPGDELVIEWKKRRHDPQKGRLLEVVNPSSERVDPKCKHVGICGGCSWQQIDYSAQLKEKERRVAKVFPGHTIEPIFPSEPRFGYRNKMEFTFSENRGGQKFLGLMIAQAEPYVYNVEECFLGPDWFIEVLSSIRAWWDTSGVSAYRPPEDSGSLRYLTLRAGIRTGQKMAILNVSGNPSFALTQPQLDGYKQAVLKVMEGEEISIFLRIHQTKKGTPTHFFEMLLHGKDHIVEELHLKEKKLSLKVSPISFFQPNTYQAEKLYDAAAEMLGSCNLLYDLYCGTGTLAMALASKAKKVVGIELSPEAVLDAEENIKRNGIENVTVHQGDVGKVLTQLLTKSDFERPDAVIVDPPRAGLDPLALHHLKNLFPQKIIYISCNPLTQAANIAELVQAGYRLTKLQPVDQFPHTYHIENIALLVR